MAVDNDVYNELPWWDDDQPFATLEAFTPARFDYFHRVLTDRLHLDPAGLRVLDIGWGGGLMAEGFSRVGAHVTGVDASGPSLASAREHAAQEGLAIEYQEAVAEDFKEAKFEGSLSQLISFSFPSSCDLISGVSSSSLMRVDYHSLLL